MSKIAIVTDSNSGITPAQAKELGLHVLPMPFIINGVTYFDGVTLTKPEFYEKIKGDVEMSTSQPSPEDVTNFWDELLKEYDEIIHIPTASTLSGSCSTAYGLALEYEGKVKVVDNHRISVSLRQAALDALKLVEMGKSAQEVCDILTEDTYNSCIYLLVDTLHYLKKGGRITPTAAALGTLLKIKPVLNFQGERIDAYAKARTVKQGKDMMLNALKNDIEKRFGCNGKADDVFIQIIHANNLEGAEAFKAEVQAFFPQYKNIIIDDLALSVAIHTGPGAIAVGACRKLDIYK